MSGVVVMVKEESHRVIAENVLEKAYYTWPEWGGMDYSVVVGDFLEVEGADELLGVQIFSAVRNAIDKAEYRYDF